jgi:topoisomerase-4 subunit A
VTKDGMGIRFPRSEVSATGRASSGVKAISLAAGDEVVALLPTEAEDARSFNLLTAEGQVKRTLISAIPLQGRAGKGVQVIRKRKTNPHRVVAVTVEDTLYALTDRNEWVLVPTEQVAVTEQGGAARSVVDGGVEAVAYEAVLPDEAEKAAEPPKGSAEAEPDKTPRDGNAVTQFSLFDNSADEKE